MPVHAVQKLASWLRSTPIHPQWLMPGRLVSTRLRGCRGKLLDIGAANRWLESEVCSEVTYIALDYPRTAIGLYGTKPDVFADASGLPFADASIDAVACFEVVEHIARPEKMLAEIARVLAPGGFAEFSMPFLYPVHDAPHDYQRWTAHGWSMRLVNAGFDIESIEPRGHSLHAAAVTACLALAGPLREVGAFALILRLPLLTVMILLINLSAWTASWIWPSWSALAVGHRVVARKPE